MAQQHMTFESMDPAEVRRRHRIFAIFGAASLFTGGWLIVVENIMLMGFVVLAPGALTFGMSSRLAQIPVRLQFIGLGISVAVLFFAAQYREAHSLDAFAPAGVPKCSANQSVPAGGCYTVSVSPGVRSK